MQKIVARWVELREREGSRRMTEASAALFFLASAFVFRWVMDPLWRDRLPYMTFFLAFFVITRFAGAATCIVACCAGFLLADLFFIAPRHSFFIASRMDRLSTFYYFALCFVLAWFSLRARQAARRERQARAALARLAAIIESSDDAIVGNTLDGKIVSWNAGARRLYGYSEAEALRQPIDILLPAVSGENIASLLHLVARGENINHFETTRRRKSGALVEVSLTISPVRDGDGRITGASMIARDISAWKRVERERESLVAELRDALAEVKTLTGLLPICAHCKKIRDDKGYWRQIEQYVHEHSHASFTHGICPECVDSFFKTLPRERIHGL